MGRRFLNPPPTVEIFEPMTDSHEGSNYVIASWSGPRRKGGAGDEILASHLDNLRTLSHDLAQVVVVVPHNPTEPPAYRKLIRSLPAKVGGARVVLLERPNHAMSYGGWRDAMAVWEGCFPYHFLMEDDFVYARDGFDAECVELLHAGTGASILCGGASQDGTYGTVGNCVIPDQHARACRQKYAGRMPLEKGYGYKSEGSQSVFGINFWRLGIKLLDMRDDYGVSFQEENSYQIWPHEAGWMMVSLDHWKWLHAHRVRAGTCSGDGGGGGEGA